MEKSSEELRLLRERISSLQDSSILAALRGLSKKISSQRTLGVKRPSPDDDLSRLLPSFVSLLDRISRLESEDLGKTLRKHVRDVLVEEIPWAVEVLFRRYVGEFLLQQDALHAIFDALEVDGKDRGCVTLYDAIAKSFERAPVEYQSKYKVIFEICIKRSIARLKESVDCTDYCCGVWWPCALGLASLPLLDSRFRGSLDVLQDSYGTFLPMIERLSHKFVDPEWVVMSIAGGKSSTDSLDQETVGQNLDATVGSVELIVQILVSILCVMDEEERPKIGDANWIEVHRMISKVLTIRWELGQFAGAVGYSEVRPVEWPLDIGIRLLPFFVESSGTLLMTPPQITLVLDMMTRQGKRPKTLDLDEERMQMLKLLETLLEASIKGLMSPKKVLFAESTQLFANLAQRTRVSFTQDDRFGALLAQKDALDSDEKDEPRKNDIIAEHDEDVDELLAMITAKNDTPQEKRPKKIQPERIDDKPSCNEGIGTVKSEEKLHVSSYHKGRVIMPATYNLDSETREILWQAYIEDKDKLVEMLGDSNYHQWHDETQRPSSHRKRGLDVAFDAIFGESTGQNDAEFELKNGMIVDDVPKRLIDVSSLFPWQSLISGALMLAYHVVNSASNPETKARLLCHIVGGKSRESAVSAALKLLQPDYSRSAWKNGCTVVKGSPTVGCLLYVSYQFRQVAIQTTRHSIDLMVRSFLELLQACNSLLPEDIHRSKAQAKKAGSSVHPLDLVQGMMRSCMTFPPLLGSTIDSKSASYIPDLCGLGEETEVLCYTASCCWVVWQSLHSKKKLEAFWLAEENLDLWSHPVITARIPAKYQFLTSSLSLMSRKIQELAEDSENIHSALQACSSLCATLCINIVSIFSGSHSNRATEPGVYHICQQKKFNLSLFSVMSALCEIYCGLAEDWEEVVLGTWDQPNDEFPDAGSIIIGMDVAEACKAYLSVVDASDPNKIDCIPDTLVSPVQAIVGETHHRMTIVMESIQKLDKQSDIYKTAIKEIQNTPDIIIVDKDSTRHSKYTSTTKGKTVQDIKNPFVRAIIQESGRKGSDALDDDVSDLEDFIVADPTKDYDEFIADHFPLDQSSNDSGADEDG